MAPGSRTPGVWMATTFGAPATSTRQSRNLAPPTRSKPNILQRKKIPVRLRLALPAQPRSAGDSYQYIGQMRKAEELFRRSLRSIVAVCAGPKQAEWPVFRSRAGVPQEALAAANTMAAHRSPVGHAAGHVEAGCAHLALGQFKDAVDEGNTALRLMRGNEGSGMVADPLKAFPGRVPASHGRAGPGDARCSRTPSARHARGRGWTTGPRACSRLKRLRTRRACKVDELGAGSVGRASDAITQSELRRLASRARARRRTRRRHADSGTARRALAGKRTGSTQIRM